MGYATGRVDIPLQCGFGIVPHSQRALSATNVTSDSVQFMDNLKESYNTINCTQRKKSGTPSRGCARPLTPHHEDKAVPLG